MGPIYFTLTKIFLQPFPLLLLLVGLALANLWRKRRERRRRLLLPTVPFLLLVVSSVPAVVYPLVGFLEWPYPPLAKRPSEIDAIVVLSGGILEADQVRLRPELAEDTLRRCLHAAELYHSGKPCRVIVTGGALDPKSGLPPVAPAMLDLLVRLGVNHSDVIVEPTARTTFENAVETRVILEQKGLTKVALVTEAVHMSRSLRCFRKQGINAVPAACFHRATGFKIEAGSFVPSPGALKTLMAVGHEWLGTAWYWMQGKI